MPGLESVTEYSFKEAVTGIELRDITKDGRDNLIATTMAGDIRLFDFSDDPVPKLEEIVRTEEMPPVASFAMGDVTGNGIEDFVVGGMDFVLRILSFEEGKIVEKTSTPLGSLPTSLISANVLGKDNCEIIVATNDKALRCYGWYDSFLDKLAHKVVEQPVFTMKTLLSDGMPFHRFIFGDDSNLIYLYQYADDRLHERDRVETNGSVSLVTSGHITESRHEEVISVSDFRHISLFAFSKKPKQLLARIHAPGDITSIRVAKLLQDARSPGQILSCQGNSVIAILSFEGRQLFQEATLRVAPKAIESLVCCGDINGDGALEIIQSTGNTVHLIAVDE